jgi:hypothetical protein
MNESPFPSTTRNHVNNSEVLRVSHCDIPTIVNFISPIVGENAGEKQYDLLTPNLLQREIQMVTSNPQFSSLEMPRHLWENLMMYGVQDYKTLKEHIERNTSIVKEHLQLMRSKGKVKKKHEQMIFLACHIQSWILLRVREIKENFYFQKFFQEKVKNIYEYVNDKRGYFPQRLQNLSPQSIMQELTRDGLQREFAKDWIYSPSLYFKTSSLQYGVDEVEYMLLHENLNKTDYSYQESTRLAGLLLIQWGFKEAIERIEEEERFNAELRETNEGASPDFRGFYAQHAAR